MILFEKMYSPQEYLELVTNKCYIMRDEDDVTEIHRLLEFNNYNARSYSLSEIYRLNDGDFVLVECSVWDDETEEFTYVYRWFEVPIRKNQEDA